MKETTIATTRRGNTPIKVYCLPEEKQQIEANAAATGLSTLAYLLKVGQGYRVRGILDHQRVEERARINGDLGRPSHQGGGWPWLLNSTSDAHHLREDYLAT